MAYIALEQAKQHLIIDETYTVDDDYIRMLIEAAEITVAKDVCEDLKDLEVKPGEIPAPLKYAILLQVGDYYNSRETVAFVSTLSVVPTYKHLIGLYRNYSK